MIQIGASGFVQNVLCTGFTKCSFQRFPLFSVVKTHDKPGFPIFTEKRAAGDGGLTIQCIDQSRSILFILFLLPLREILSRYSKEISSIFASKIGGFNIILYQTLHFVLQSVFAVWLKSVVFSKSACVGVPVCLGCSMSASLLLKI